MDDSVGEWVGGGCYTLREMKNEVSYILRELNVKKLTGISNRLYTRLSLHIHTYTHTHTHTYTVRSIHTHTYTHIKCILHDK